MRGQALNDLLDPVPATCVRIALTTACNLRCVYCAVSAPEWRSEQIDMAALERVAGEIPTVAQPDATILVNGAGETTFMAGWQATCEQLIGQGLALGMTTNLARVYDADELSTLSRFSALVVSIDSFEVEMSRSIRRKVSPRRIAENIRLIQSTARVQGLPEPSIKLSCGLYDQSSVTIIDFAAGAVELGVCGVIFWDLEAHEALPTHGQVRPLRDLPDAELHAALNRIDVAVSCLAGAGVEVEVAGDFLAPLKARLGSATG